MNRLSLLILAALLPTALCLPANGQTVSPGQFLILLRGPESPAPTMLERELCRQAILLCARDEMGLFTRDEVLREVPPQNLGDLSNRTVTLRVSADEQNQLIRLALLAKGTTTKMDIPRAYREGGILDPQKLALIVERKSRTEFYVWLNGAGIQGPALPPGSNVKLPDAVESELLDTSIFAQYDAVRQIHALIKNSGPSPDLLSGLARGYANLGQLTRFHWNGESDVFTARSLLYTQRLLSLYPESTLGQWSEAYALSMAGLHDSALRAIAAAQAAHADQPDWAAVIEPLCKYQTQKLIELAADKDKLNSLATFCAYLTVENTALPTLILRVGETALQANRFCERVQDSMCDRAQFNFSKAQVARHSNNGSYFDSEFYNNDTMDSLTQRGLSDAVDSLRKQLRLVNDIPGNVKKAADAAHTNPDLMEDVATVARAFVDTDEQAEPSWSLLGRMLQESNFVHVYRRVWTMMMMEQHSSIPEFLAKADPLIRGHPLIGVIDDTAQVKSHDTIDREIAQAPFLDVSYRWPMLMDVGWVLPGERYHNFLSAKCNHLDPTAYDYETGLLYSIPEYTWQDRIDDHARKLLAISPYSPIGPCVLLRRDKSHNPEALPQWEDRFAGQAVFNYWLGRAFMRDKNWDKAAEQLQKCVAAAPEMETEALIARCYYSLNQPDLANAAMTAGLQLKETYQNESADTQLDLANFIAARGFWHDAATYAAAASLVQYPRSRPAEQLAMKAFVQTADWDGLTSWRAARCKAMGADFEWYLACRQTGHGDLDGARQAAAQLVTEQSQNPDTLVNLPEYTDQTQAEISLAEYNAGEKQPADERTAVKIIFDKRNNPDFGLWLASIYDAEGDSDGRISTLTDIVQNGPHWEKDRQNPNPELIDLAQLLANSTAQGQPLGEAATKQFDTLPPGRLAVIDYFLGEYMVHHNQQDQGNARLAFAAKALPFDSFPGNLARMELHDAGAFPPVSATTQTAP
jgi:hypothetical protein